MSRGLSPDITNGAWQLLQSGQIEMQKSCFSQEAMTSIFSSNEVASIYCSAHEPASLSQINKPTEGARLMSDQATYQYTAQGWLKKVIFANGDTVEYFYDSMGNRTSVVVTIA